MSLAEPRVDSGAGTGPRTHAVALAVLTSLFFAWGLITSLNDILVPHFKAVFTLNYVQAMLIQLCFFGAYLVCSLPSGYLVERFGYRAGIILGLSVSALGCLGFYPAAAKASYPFFLASLFVLATGITLLQVAANPCVTSLGPVESAASRLNLTQAFNSLGTTLGPALGALFILPVGAGAGGAHEIDSVKAPYLMLAAALAGVALAFSRLRLPRAAPSSAAGGSASGSVWKEPHLLLGALGIFLYVGAEVSIGSFLVNFLAAPEIAGLPEHAAGRYLSIYWGLAMVGRFAGSALLRRALPGRLLAAHAAMAVVLLLSAIAFRGHVAMWAVLAVGLCNSIMFPTIFALAVAGFGERTGEASGALCMAIVGGAVVPVLMGFVADQASLVAAFAVPAVCYAYVVHYGLAGHVPRSAMRQNSTRPG